MGGEGSGTGDRYCFEQSGLRCSGWFEFLLEQFLIRTHEALDKMMNRECQVVV